MDAQADHGNPFFLGTTTGPSNASVCLPTMQLGIGNRKPTIELGIGIRKPTMVLVLLGP